MTNKTTFKSNSNFHFALLQNEAKKPPGPLKTPNYHLIRCTMGNKSIECNGTEGDHESDIDTLTPTDKTLIPLNSGIAFVHTPTHPCHIYSTRCARPFPTFNTTTSSAYTIPSPTPQSTRIPSAFYIKPSSFAINNLDRIALF